jgi:hypothetical protein
MKLQVLRELEQNFLVIAFHGFVSTDHPIALAFPLILLRHFLLNQVSDIDLDKEYTIYGLFLSFSLFFLIFDLISLLLSHDRDLSPMRQMVSTI